MLLWGCSSWHTVVWLLPLSSHIVPSTHAIQPCRTSSPVETPSWRLHSCTLMRRTKTRCGSSWRSLVVSTERGRETDRVRACLLLCCRCCCCCCWLQLDKLREQLKGLMEQEHQIQQHKAALGQLQASYQPSADTTEFANLIQHHMQQAQAQDR